MRGKLVLLGALVALVVAVSMMSVVGAAAPGSRSGGAGADATARLKDVEGDFVGWVRFEAHKGGVVEVEAKVDGVKPPGQFHGFHLHTTGKCDPKSVDPATDEVVPFFSAGGHFNPTSEIHSKHAGDFPALLVMKNGQAQEKFKTDRFRLSQLFDEDGSAVIVHAGRDNYANIPDRYHSHEFDVFGPDELTKATGDAGDRFACGVVKRT